MKWVSSSGEVSIVDAHTHAHAHTDLFLNLYFSYLPLFDSHTYRSMFRLLALLSATIPFLASMSSDIGSMPWYTGIHIDKMLHMHACTGTHAHTWTNLLIHYYKSFICIVTNLCIMINCKNEH